MESALTKRTERVYPLDDLKKYRGGYNITNKHYWGSTIFTGKFGYIIAALWIITGLIYAIILLVSTPCFNQKQGFTNEKLPCAKKYCIWHIIFAILFTLLAIVSSGVALGGSTRFHSRATGVNNIIVNAANNASGTIYNVTKAVKAMQSDPQVYSGLTGSSSLNSTLRRLDGEADNIRRKAGNNMRKLNKGLKILNVVTIITVSISLLAVIILLASEPFLRFRRAFHMIVFLCWVLTFLFWLYFGLYYFLNKFAGDTCAALDEYQHDPRNSTLSSILPCNDQTSANMALYEVGSGIYNIIDQVNTKISSLQSSLQDTQLGVEYVCNPFSGPPDYNYQPRNCSSDTIQIGNIPQILKKYTCSNETCKHGEFVSPSNYSTAVIYTSSIQNILNSYQGMETLVSCQLVKDAFMNILYEECPPLKKYANMTWAAFATLATVMVILLITRVVEVSVNPHSTSVETPEESEMVHF